MGSTLSDRHRLVAQSGPVGAGAGDDERRVEGETGPDGGTRLDQPARGAAANAKCENDNFDWPRRPSVLRDRLVVKAEGESSRSPR